MSKIIPTLLLACLGTLATPAPAAAAVAPLPTAIVTALATQEEGEAEPSALDENVATEQAQKAMSGISNVLAENLGVPVWAAEWIAKLAVFVLILVAFRIVAGILAGAIRRAMTASKLQPTRLFQDFVAGTTRKVVVLIGLLMGLSVLGVPLGPLLAGIGVLGFVIGFALQETLSNFAAGVMILLYRPYDIGDVVTAGGVTGSVKSMNLVSTTIGTPDNQVQIVPNSGIWGGVITNVTANDTRRVDLVAGIGYGDDIDKAEETLRRILEGHDLVLADPAPVIKVSELGDSSVNLIVRPWCKTSDYWAVKWDITKAIKQEFDKEGINIPFPQRDVHLYKVD